jgi:adenosylcobinamide-GDP ribazoletransferase
MPGRGAQDIVDDIAICLAFYTRLPVRLADGKSFADAQWAAPVAGLVVGATGWLAFFLADACGLPPAISGALAVASTVFVTGALHEDGLADTADGFGGGSTRERKLEIMRDSRIGTFGALALLFSVLLRSAALSALATPTLVFGALVASHAVARALMPVFMRLAPPARADGLSANTGAIPDSSAIAAALIGGGGLLFLGVSGAVLAALALAILLFAARHVCRHQIGGQTGDVLGAVEQLSEITVLLIACAILN